jgi:hypothetical protein
LNHARRGIAFSSLTGIAGGLRKINKKSRRLKSDFALWTREAANQKSRNSMNCHASGFLIGEMKFPRQRCNKRRRFQRRSGRQAQDRSGGRMRLEAYHDFAAILKANPNGVLATADGNKIKTRGFNTCFRTENKVYFAPTAKSRYMPNYRLIPTHHFAPIRTISLRFCR